MVAPLFLSLAIAAASFYAGRYLLVSRVTRREQERLNKYYRKYYKELYNEQMEHVCRSYNRDRAAMIHRYEGLISEVEREFARVRDLLDVDKTAITPPSREFARSEATDTHSDSGWCKKAL